MANLVLKTTLFMLFSVGPVFGVELYAETDHTFQPKLTGKPQNILWKFKGNKVVEYENNHFYWYKDYKSRGQLDIQSGELTLKNLTKDDSGVYQSEIQVDGKLQYSNYDITVIEKPDHTGAVIGGVVGGIILVILTGLAVAYIKCKEKFPI
ncbi:lymphocyte function-associated antigen 3-like [Hoplias malabaricus]|uniref:lymphocyte function-associated antigen 3-like n=1 Tax=Hoplias malabaricus TaxID=27720 RepID=UPI00346230C0